MTLRRWETKRLACMGYLLKKVRRRFNTFIYKIYKILSCPDHPSWWLENYFEFHLVNFYECRKLKNLMSSLNYTSMLKARYLTSTVTSVGNNSFFTCLHDVFWGMTAMFWERPMSCWTLCISWANTDAIWWLSLRTCCLLFWIPGGCSFWHST